MQTWVALLRGINVGGHNKVPMAPLRDTCIGLGWRDVRSYIASGNLVFCADGDAAGLAVALQGAMTVKVPVLVLSGDDLRARLAACPFERDAGKAAHGFFCFDPPKIDTAQRDRFIAASESLQMVGQTVWLHAPDGIGRSKLAEKIAHVITGTGMTARNLNTVIKLVEMLDA